MKKYLILLFVFIITNNYAQEKKYVDDKVETKMDLFDSKTGVIIKFIDTKMNSIKTNYGTPLETRIRKIISGTMKNYFFQIVNSSQHGSSTASIEYADILEVIKAINILKIEVEKDLLLNPDYLENKFTTIDGFKIGYYINKGKIVWFLNLEKSRSDKTIFLKDILETENSFEEAKNRIEELKNN